MRMDGVGGGLNPALGPLKLPDRCKSGRAWDVLTFSPPVYPVFLPFNSRGYYYLQVIVQVKVLVILQVIR
jgi:hypothetical protein